MVMIAHDAIGMDDRPKFFAGFTNYAQKSEPVPVGECNGLFLVPSGRDVIERPGVLDPELSGHYRLQRSRRLRCGKISVAGIISGVASALFPLCR